MPTNLLRDRSRANPDAANSRRSPPPPARGEQIIRIRVGAVELRVRLIPGRTAERLMAALPLYSTAEPWGDVIHFALPVEIGRDRSARVNARPGEVYLWAEDDRILLPFGSTPISRQGEIRLPRPCNVLGECLDDLGALRTVRPSEKVSVLRD